MRRRRTLLCQIALCFSFLPLLIGCPDRSMLRPYPDLSKQSDTDAEDSEGVEAEESESPDQTAPSSTDSTNAGN